MADKVSKPAAPLEVSMEKEPSSPLPVPSMDDKKQPPLLAMAVVLDVKLSPPTPASMDKKEKPPAVLFVCLWALANAISFAVNAVAMLIMNRNPCTKMLHRRGGSDGRRGAGAGGHGPGPAPEPLGRGPGLLGARGHRRRPLHGRQGGPHLPRRRTGGRVHHRRRRWELLSSGAGPARLPLPPHPARRRRRGVAPVRAGEA
uniref:Uncharacterized protein n=1 Tax=Setaria italica TaxID=4555 RepID=K3XZF5_SETIT